MISIRFVLALAVAALSTACSTAPAPAAAVSPPTLVLVSIDGLRADMLDRGATPNLQQLAREGVHAEGMRPSYPSLTFPNHYTIVTGLRPDRHGIVHNSMWEDGLGMFRLGDRDAVTDPRWWGGEPLWVSAEKAGLPTATWSWPGSEAPIQGVRPRQWRIYDESVSLPDRVAQVLGWLQQPGSERPRLVTLYMEHVDKAGHDHGPDSAEYRGALEVVDSAIGLLLDGLRDRQLLDRVDLVVVSDHGMAAVPDGHAVITEDMVPPTVARVVSAGQSVGFAPLPGQEEAAERHLLGEHEHYACWRREQLPARWHYGSHPRIPAIVCQMEEGWAAMPAAYRPRLKPGTRGAHGYDPALPSMQAVFVAKGPSFRERTTLPVFDNVDVYPLLTRLLGLSVPPNDGNPQTLLPALRQSTP